LVLLYGRAHRGWGWHELKMNAARIGRATQPRMPPFLCSPALSLSRDDVNGRRSPRQVPLLITSKPATAPTKQKQDEIITSPRPFLRLFCPARVSIYRPFKG
jgi:hypothetical protein